MEILEQFKVPRDAENPAFVKDFTLDQEEEYKAFFEKFGFVVIKNILSPDECAATIDDIWTYMEQKKYLSAPASKKMEQVLFRNDPTTWSAAPFDQEGIVGYTPIFTKRALLNRQNENLYKLHTVLYGRKDLMINQDRYGCFFPTLGVKHEGTTLDFPERKTKTNIHLDMNPWNYVNDADDSHAKKILNNLRYKRIMDFIIENNEVGCQKLPQLHIQGLINLLDNFEEDGGFQLVPGFHHYISQWSKLNNILKQKYSNHQTFIMLPANSDIEKYAIRITARAGSAIVWNQTVAHGSKCNNSDKFRMAQFFKVFPAKPMDEERFAARQKVVQQKIEESKIGEQITSLGKKLFGQEEWESIQQEQEK